MQLSFLPEIDRDETRRNVEAALEKYKMMLLMSPKEIEPKITSSFKLVSVAPSNLFYSTTEETAIKKVDMENKIRNYLKKIQRAVNRLSYQERELIIKRYLNTEDIYDYQTYTELGYSESKYYRIKSDAFYKLAFILKIAVYKEVQEV